MTYRLIKAYQAGYYDSMVEFIRILFGNAFKTNDSLKFAVMTGCLRISKESIFTGLNNFKVYTVKDVRYKEYFGFTDAEVRQMLEYYGLTGQYDAIKECMMVICLAALASTDYCAGQRDSNHYSHCKRWIWQKSVLQSYSCDTHI